MGGTQNRLKKVDARCHPSQRIGVAIKKKDGVSTNAGDNEKTLLEIMKVDRGETPRRIMTGKKNTGGVKTVARNSVRNEWERRRFCEVGSGTFLEFPTSYYKDTK